MRLKKVKYIFFVLICLVPFGQLVFSRDVYGGEMFATMQQPDSLPSDSAMVDSVFVESDTSVVIESRLVEDVLGIEQQSGSDSLRQGTTAHKSFLRILSPERIRTR